MKITFPKTVLATSLNLGAMVAGSHSTDAASAEPSWPSVEDGQEAASDGQIFESVLDDAEECITLTAQILVEEEWDRAAERRFRELAVREAMGTITVDELLDLENLSSLRRKGTGRKPSGDEILKEMSQWRSMQRVVEALDRYVEEIGLKPASRS